MRRFFVSCMAAVVGLALVSTSARAGQIGLPSTLNNLEGAGNYAIVGNLMFYDFTYSTDPTGATPQSTNVTVDSFTTGPETGIVLKGGFGADPGMVVDYALTYYVTTTDGSMINDAYLSVVGGAFGGTGNFSISENFYDAATNASLLDFEATKTNKTVSGDFLYGVKTVKVSKDMFFRGGSEGSTASIIYQGFSTTVIPEPTSMALLGIGLSGLVTFRRFFKRTSIV